MSRNCKKSKAYVFWYSSLSSLTAISPEMKRPYICRIWYQLRFPCQKTSLRFHKFAERNVRYLSFILREIISRESQESAWTVNGWKFWQFRFAEYDSVGLKPTISRTLPRKVGPDANVFFFWVLGYNHRNGISHKKRRVKVNAYDIFKMTHRQIWKKVCW